MKSLSKTICHLTYKLRCFLSMLLFTTCSLSFIAFGADGDNSTSTSTSTTTAPTLIKLKRPEPKTKKTNQPTNSTLSTVSTTPLVRNNPCNLIKIKDSATDKEKDAAKSSCNNFFDDQKAAGNQSSFAKAVAVSTAKELLDAVNNAHDNGTIIILSFGEYPLAEQLIITKRVALVGMKQNDVLPTIKMTSELLEKNPEENALVYLYRQENGASKGFYSAFINWETNIDNVSYDGSVYTIFSSSYPGEIRLYGNTFIHSDENIDLDEFVFLSNPGGMVYIDSNQFNTSNLFFSAVYSTCRGCNEFEPEVIITNNTLTSSNSANIYSNNAFHLVAHTKFTIENNKSLNRKANASIEIELPYKAELQSSIKNNNAHIDASIKNRIINIDQDHDNITGSLEISKNNYFNVEHGDEDGVYITLTEGKKVPARSSTATTSLSPTPTSVLTNPSVTTTPAPAKNPCEAIKHDLLAYKTCNEFLTNPQATGGDKDFSHAFVVHNAHELLKAVEKDHLDGNPFSGSIIILKAGTFTLHRQLRINHRVAFVGEKSGIVLPKIQAGKDILKQFHEFNSLAYLKEDSSQSTSGFFSSKIIWDTSLDTEIKDVVCEAAIGSSFYSGKIRIFQNQFKHQENKIDVNDFIKFKDAYGDTYIGHNTFDTTHLKNATVDARCVSCLNFDPKLEIVSNSFTSKEDSERKKVATALEIKGYKRFRIEKNEQKNTKAAAYINVQLKNGTAGLNGLIRYNVALQGAPAEQREIKLHSFKKHGLPLSISGSLTTTPNTHYSIDDSEGLVAHIGTTIQEYPVAFQSTSTMPVATPSSVRTAPTGQVVQTNTIKPAKTISTSSQSASIAATTTPVAGTNPCNMISDDDTAKASCNNFFNNKKAAGPNPSFGKAIVVTDTEGLVNAINNASQQGSIIILHFGIYEINDRLNIKQTIALVGIKNGSSRPIIKPTKEFFEQDHIAFSLVHLDKKTAARSKGFFSTFISWDNSISPDETLAPSELPSKLEGYSIYSQGYQGVIRLHGNTFSHSYNKHDKITLSDFVYLVNPGGPAYIDSNLFNTDRVYYSAVDSDCSGCNGSDPEIVITSNTLTSGSKETPTQYSFSLTGHRKFTIESNSILTSQVNASMNITLPNEAGLQATIKNNTAHKEAATSRRAIEITADEDYYDIPKIAGKLEVSKNDYFIVEHDDDDRMYLTLTEGKKVPEASSTIQVTSSPTSALSTQSTSSITTQTPTGSTTPATISNPCDDLKDKATAQTLCNNFLKNSQATGNDKNFSHAFEVSNTKELNNALDNGFSNGKRYGRRFSGSIIILRLGTYELSKQLIITHKVALVGEKSGKSLPVIKAKENMVSLGDIKNSLVYLHDEASTWVSTSTSGFYSTQIQWDTTVPNGDSHVTCDAAIYSKDYSGKIRIFDNSFQHLSTYSRVSYYLDLNSAYGDTFIAQNTFDTTRLNHAAISGLCTNCLNFNPKLEILSNKFTARKNSAPARNVKAIDIYRYTRFWIDGNKQEDANAAAFINVKVKNHIDRLHGFIRNNIAHQQAPANQRAISVRQTRYGSDMVSASGSVQVSGNDFYSLKAPGLIRDLIAYTEGKRVELIASQPTPQTPVATATLIAPTPASITPAPTEQVVTSTSATQPSPVTSSITPTKPSTAICDRDNIVSSLHVTSSEIDACKAFLKSEKASAGQSFDKVVVIDSASDLVQAVTGQFHSAGADASKLIVLRNGTYEIPHSLNIIRKIALVGVVKDGSYPVIRAADHFSTGNHNTHALAYLYDDQAVAAKKSFYSHHIHWDTTNPPGKFRLLYKGAINSQFYTGEFRLYENQFSESKHNSTVSYIQLTDATENAYINSNRFDTTYLSTSAIYANCVSIYCVTTPPLLEISSNHFYSEARPFGTIRPKMMMIEGHVRYKILANLQETKHAAGKIHVKDHTNTLHLDAYIQNNIAHSEAPMFQREIIVESFFSPEESIDITGKLHASGNDYYKFKESGLDLKYVDYTPGKSLASSKHPCDDIKDDATAFATCDAFLKNEKASGPTSSKPTFSHAFIVDNTKSLMDAVKQGRFDGKRFIGSIIVLRPGTYELPQPLLINHRIALLGEKDKEGAFPTIKAANNFNAPTGNQYVLAYLYRSVNAQDTGFFSFNLKWKISLPATTSIYGTYTFEAIISSQGYGGEIRLSDNHFGHDGEKVNSVHILILPNTGQRYYIGDNIFDTSRVIFNAVESRAPYSGSHESRIEIKSNTFMTSLEPDFPDIKSIVLYHYQYLSVLDNVQESARAAGSIEINFNNNVDIKDATVRNNKAHRKAAKDQRTIWLKLNKDLRDTPVVSGFVDVKDNDYYEFSYSGLPKANFHHEYGKKAGSDSSASLALSTTPVTPTPSHNVPGSTQSVKSMSTPSVPAKPSVHTKTPPLPSGLPWLKSTAHAKTLPPLTSLCNRLSSVNEVQSCQKFQDKLKKMELDITFSEVVAVKSSEELISEAAGASESGKVILLHTGSYLLDQPLHMRNKIALVGIGNPVIKSAYTVYSTESRALILLNDEATSHGFYSKGITWDITAPDHSESQPYSSAIKAMNYQGDVVILDDDFQYQSTRESEEAPAHYIDIQKSTGNVHIADSTFFTGGLKEATIYANCKECLKDNQYIDIVGNRFTDTEGEKSTPIAIDVRHYKALNIHRNVQETNSATAQIHIVLPSHKDDINALIKDNIALDSATTEKRTIFLTVDRLAKVPVSIGGSVRVFNNQCYTVRNNGIPSHILDIIRGSCSATASPQVQSETQTSGGMNNKDWAGPAVGIGIALLYVGTGVYGRTNLPGHAKAHAIFIFPKTAALFIASKIAGQYHKIRSHHQKGDRANIQFNKLAEQVQMQPGLDDSTRNLVDPEDKDTDL